MFWSGQYWPEAHLPQGHDSIAKARNIAIHNGIIHSSVHFTLAVSEPSDPAEVEADRVTDQLFPLAHNPSTSSVEYGASTVRRAPAFELLAPLQSARPGDRGGVNFGGTCTNCAAESLQGVVATTGSPLPEHTRREMETAFGSSFSNVRIHTDERAAKLSRSLGALAFTYGNDIFFDDGQFTPETSSGRRLLAHELTHTIQQRTALASIARQGRGRTALQCVNENLASMGIAGWLITVVGGTCGLIGAFAGSPTGPGAAGTAAFGAALCIAGLTGLSMGVVSRMIYECIRDPNARVGLPGTISEATPPAPTIGEQGASAVA
jgi:hypothetical protein